MSDIQAGHTQIAKSTGIAQTGAGLKGGGLFGGASGLAFWDMIVTQLGTGLESGKPGNNNATSATLTPVAQEEAVISTEVALMEGDLDLGLTIDESVLALLDDLDGEQAADDPNKPMSLMELLTAMQASDEKSPVDLPTTRLERVKKQIDIFQKLIDKLTAGLPLEAKGDSALEELVSRLQKQQELLQTGKLNDEEVPFPLLIALGISPAELTQVMGKIAKVEEKLGRELTVEDIIAGVGGIIPAEARDERTARIGFASGGIPADVADLPDGTQSNDKLAARLNNIAPGGQPDELQGYRRLSERTGQAPANDAGAQANNAAKKASAFANMLAVSNTAGDVTLSQSWHPLFSENISAFSGFDIQTGLPISQAAQAAHTATAVAQAGQNHPATQLVHTTLNKMAKDGGPTEMTIQMDPPELGRVLAKLHFGKDKSVKAVLMIEKPETYQMLIRDAASLERALQNAGLTTDSASLSFELAQDGSAFNSDNNGQGGGEPSGRQAAGESGDEDIIQASMTWQVDSQTGYVRYNLLA